MLTAIQKETIIKLALDTYASVDGIKFNPIDFDAYVDKPTNVSLCTIYIFSKRTDDELRIKLHVEKFDIGSYIGSFIFTHEPNYSTGGDDQVYVGVCTLDDTIFESFQRYIASPSFKETIVQATDRIMLEDGSGCLLTEYAPGNLILEN